MNDDGTYNLTEVQARAILDLRLQRLTQIGVKEVTDELEELAGQDQGIPGYSVLARADHVDHR